MLVFAAFTPYSPLLLPSIAQDQIKMVMKTRQAMLDLAEDLYATHPDTIVLISEHPTSYADSFSISLSDPYKFDLSEFGDLGYDQTFRPRTMLIDRLQRSLRRNGQPVTLTSDDKLNYASAVPLKILTENLNSISLVPITYCDLDAKAHFQFGQALKDEIFSSSNRVAVIACGDMSHALTSESPAGFHKDGEKFDAKIQELLSQKNTAGLISLDEELVKNAAETCYRPLTILFGLLERVSVKPEILSYEAPFGVGYLVANFVLK
ncbi:MAG: class III extradiol dioxygenase subunit B-like domain-containing protein [Patescibacteria group bacterium]